MPIIPMCSTDQLDSIVSSNQGQLITCVPYACQYNTPSHAYQYNSVLHMCQQILCNLQIRGPRLVQGAMASVGDLFLFFLSRRLAGRDVAKWALLCQLLSWFTGYCITRTLSNCTETALVTAALFYFPWPGHNQ